MPAQDFIDLAPAPDLHPLYPTPQYIDDLLPSLNLDQQHALTTHALSRAIAFADITLLTYLPRGNATRTTTDLGLTDEGGLGVVSQAILEFGEECVRLLVAGGAGIHAGDVSESI